MNFQFEDLGAFFAMGGHGPFVWSCYAVTWLALLYLMLAPMIGRSRLLARQRSFQQRQGSHPSGLPEDSQPSKAEE